MTLRRLLIAGLLLVALATAQSGNQWSEIYGTGPVSSCPSPSAGAIIHCAVTGVGVEESVNGAAYVAVNQVGPAGPQGQTGMPGEQGPVGPVGATGLTGPVQSFGTAKCPTFSNPPATTGIVLGPGCIESNP